uniref:Uncharacterized protein n=1 Tax=Romanomermis culicivorax TaxID=13658 RepID=A0A915IWF0_ROMCU
MAQILIVDYYKISTLTKYMASTEASTESPVFRIFPQGTTSSFGTMEKAASVDITLKILARLSENSNSLPSNQPINKDFDDDMTVNEENNEADQINFSDGETEQ